MKHKMILGLILVVSISSSVGIVYGIFNPISLSDWSALYNGLWSRLSGVKECAMVIPVGAQWAAKQAGYEAAILGVQAAQAILKGIQATNLSNLSTTPKVIQLGVLKAQREAWERIRNGAMNLLAGAEAIVSTTGQLAIGIATIAEKGVDLKRVEFKGTFKELATGKFQLFGLTIGSVDFTTELDLADSAKVTASKIITAIIKSALFGSKSTPSMSRF